MERMISKTLAEIYLQQGHLQEAYQILKALLERDPSNQEVQKKLMEVSERLGIEMSPKPETVPSRLSDDEKIRLLTRWLANIRKQRRK